MDEQAEKVISWIKERKIFAWVFGTLISTIIFVLFFYYLARGVAIINATLPDPSWELEVGILFLTVVGGIGLMGLIVIPAFSFAVVRKFTNIFLIESEEKERWRQRELKRIIGDLKNARKMIWNMGFSKELTDAMYKKTHWAEPERAQIHTIIEILSAHVKKKKKEEPPQELRSDEIKYLVQQKRKKASILAKNLLEEERKRRHEELDLLEELIEDVDEVEIDERLINPSPDEVPLVEAAELVEAALESDVDEEVIEAQKKAELKIEEAEKQDMIHAQELAKEAEEARKAKTELADAKAAEEVIRAAQGSKLQEAVMAENKKLKEELAEIEEARTLVEELPESFLEEELLKAELEENVTSAEVLTTGHLDDHDGPVTEVPVKNELDALLIEPIVITEELTVEPAQVFDNVDEMMEAISQEDAKEMIEEFDIEEEVVEKKKSLREVIGEAMNKITEAADDVE